MEGYPQAKTVMVAPSASEGMLCMQVLLRNRKTKLYLRGEDEWTSERTQARDFGHSSRAVQFTLDQRLNDMEALLIFGDTHYDICIPVLSPANRSSSG
jgi:hypothetical protein